MCSFQNIYSNRIALFIRFSPKTNFKLHNAFADKDENPQLPGSDWDHSFSEANGTTTVKINIYNESLERMEKMIEMGFKEGFTATLNELENVFERLYAKMFFCKQPRQSLFPERDIYRHFAVSPERHQ